MKPAGSTSVTSTPVAAPGPWLNAVMAMATVSPTSTVVGAVLVTSTSALRLSGVWTVAVLLAATGSVVAVDTVAVFTIGSGVV